MKYVRLTLRHPREMRNPMQSFIMDHESMERAELLNWNLSHSDRDYVLFRIVGELEAYDEAVANASLILDYELTPLDGTSFYAYIEHEKRDVDSDFRTAFAGTSILVIPPITYTSDGAMCMELVGRAGDMRTAMAEMDTDIDVSVEQVGEYDSPWMGLWARLTERQRSALETAVEVGYYDVPRESGVEAVGEKLDCAPSTASTHLRNAESRIMRELVQST
ncbi:bacterio-opsin activator [Haladaptatus sp. R4]|uniref:helix-turn-helix domain-containing protein n=1 Tax=Haladaptatus sp. R4 TaxID=1679489 RepID=UPI0007B4CB4B|nr:helix-turn-helix domain-containing protein [Haladaptatus sp. R4]KZN24623.1 bacterio-opsin activator [Haladaptatus sp. R4]